MSLKRNLFALTLLFVSWTPIHSLATDVDFSLGLGYPYFVVPEISLSSGSESARRWYGNYKIGMDEGYSIGFEQGVGPEQRHSFGVLVGALGVKDDERVCAAKNTGNSPGEAIGEELGCLLFEVFDEETTNGVGISYSYSFRGLNNSGVRLRFELGYGEGVDSKQERADGGIILSYQF